MKDYGTVIRGGLAEWSVVLTKTTGSWATGDTSWTWKLLLGAEATPNTLAVAITGTSLTRSTTTNSNDTMTGTFSLTNANSDLLTADKYFVEIESTDGSSYETYYGDAAGTLIVRAPYGGG